MFLSTALLNICLGPNNICHWSPAPGPVSTQLHRTMIRFTCWCFVFWFDQAFYPANKDVNVKYGDTVAARCMFTGENMTTATSIGWVNIPFKLLTSIFAVCELFFFDLYGFLWWYFAIWAVCTRLHYSHTFFSLAGPPPMMKCATSI